VYFHLQRLVTLVREATEPAPPGFDREPRLRHELRRALDAIPSEAIPPELEPALTSGEVIGADAARWLPRVQAWFETECRRSGTGD
jgi:hypothetical protein